MPDKTTVKIEAGRLMEKDAVQFNGEDYGVQKIETLSMCDLRITLVPFEFDTLPIMEQLRSTIIIVCDKKIPFLQLA